MCRGNQNTHLIFNNFFFENRAVNEIMWKIRIVEPDNQMTIWRVCVACWMPKVADIHSDYVIPIAFHCNNGYSNAHQCYVIGTSVLLLCCPLSDYTRYEEQNNYGKDIILYLSIVDRNQETKLSIKL